MFYEKADIIYGDIPSQKKKKRKKRETLQCGVLHSFPILAYSSI